MSVATSRLCDTKTLSSGQFFMLLTSAFVQTYTLIRLSSRLHPVVFEENKVIEIEAEGHTEVVYAPVEKLGVTAKLPREHDYVCDQPCEQGFGEGPHDGSEEEVEEQHEDETETETEGDAVEGEMEVPSG